MKNITSHKATGGMIKSVSRISCALKIIFSALLLITTECCLAQNWIYTVKPGDTIWDLTEKYLLDIRYWQRLQAINNVVDPYRMPPGRTLRIPAAWLRMDPVSATVLKTQGSPRIISGDGKTATLSAGMIVKTGDVIQTQNADNVSLQFEDGSKLLLEAGSHLSLEHILSFKPMGISRNRVKLKHGSMETRVPPKKQQTGTRFRIKTRSASLAVRGTVFRVNTPLLQALTRTEVLTGEVAASSAGKTRILGAKTGTIIEQGKAPRSPRKLLSEPDVSGLPEVVKRVPISFHLPLSTKAVGYRMQIAVNDEFDALLFDGKSLASLLKGPDMPDGDYVMRVRAIDKYGLQGEDSIHRFKVDARPLPPFIIAPAMGTIVREVQPEFRWTQSETAESYQFQLARDADFSKTLVEISHLKAISYTAEIALTPGDYYWRLAAVDTTGKIGPFGDPVKFVLRLGPLPPELENAVLQEEQLVVRWSGGETNQRYHFQLARDYWFEQLMYDEKADEPQIILPRPPAERYYMRVRTIDFDGYPGSFGPRQEITVAPDSYWSILAIPAIILLGL